MIEAAKWVYGSAAVAAVLVATAAIWYRAGRSVREARRVAAIARRDYRKNGWPVQHKPLPPVRPFQSAHALDDPEQHDEAAEHLALNAEGRRILGDTRERGQ